MTNNVLSGSYSLFTCEIITISYQFSHDGVTYTLEPSPDITAFELFNVFKFCETLKINMVSQGEKLKEFAEELDVLKHFKAVDSVTPNMRKFITLNRQHKIVEGSNSEHDGSVNYRFENGEKMKLYRADMISSNFEPIWRLE